MFRKKNVSDTGKLESKSEHKIPGFTNISSLFKGNSVESNNELILEKLEGQYDSAEEALIASLDPVSEEVDTVIDQPDSVEEIDLPSSTNNKAVQLIQEVQKLEDRTIKPFVDYNEGRLFYPILSKIGEVQDNISCLDDLVADGILEKKVYEKLIVCPIHPDTFSSSMRLYCPKCHSMSVEKLNLFEHKKCGYITESTNFDFNDNEHSDCPSCHKPIKNFEKEIRVPAMWYQCDDCSEKFDNAVIKLHCRKHEHDFDTNSGQFVTTFSYKLKNSEISINSDTNQIKDELLKLLQGFNFTAKLNISLKGKSGNVHDIPIYAKSDANESILIFIKNQSDGIDQSDMNSILVPKLDIDPTHTLLVTVSGLNDGVENLAKHYGIHLISEPDFSQILSRVEEFVSDWYSKNGGKK